ncbi:hypothetical protein [Streptomyces sp. MZ04]|uniref:hypothetical protein n=1 Tax=Streptomyces sp. MZ04 TaxID=2559236 RepID=UPI00107E7116|nr:hypothetical protein [Streptomyces sp. MZ04]TGB07174.1 hypothetical protein E2651_22225 [Streptomyces sp. MZ04]
MSEIADTGHDTTASTATTSTHTAHESYAFACMRCGHGWEQSYEIEHHVDAKGKEFVLYVADGRHVPSPLTRPTCVNCGGHVVRIMRAGQVSSVLDLMRRSHEPKVSAQKDAKDAPEAASGAEPDGETEPHHHHRHLSALLHPFHHRKAG